MNWQKQVKAVVQSTVTHKKQEPTDTQTINGGVEGVLTS